MYYDSSMYDKTARMYVRNLIFYKVRVIHICAIISYMALQQHSDFFLVSHYSAYMYDYIIYDIKTHIYVRQIKFLISPYSAYMYDYSIYDIKEHIYVLLGSHPYTLLSFLSTQF